MATGLFGTNTPAPQLQQTRIQPAGTPGSTFIRPQQAQTGGNLRALADALGSLNSSLNSYAQVKDQLEDDPASRANKEWIAQRQQMSIDDLRQEARAETHAGIRVRQDALESLLGERANTDFRLAWANFYETEFDRSGGDTAAAYEQMRTEYAEGLPSEVARGNFYRLTGNHFESVMASDAEEKVTFAKQQVNATIVDSWHVQIGDMVARGETDPARIAEQVFSSSASNRDFYGLSGQEQNETILALAQKFALEGNPEVAKALLNSPRKGADGAPIPALSTIPKYFTASHQLVESAQGVHDKAANEASFDVRLEVNRKVAIGAFTEEDARALDGQPFYNDGQLAGLVTQSAANRAQIASRTATDEQKRLLRLEHERVRNDALAAAVSASGEIGGSLRLRDVEVPSRDGLSTSTYTRAQQIEDARSHMETQWESTERALVEERNMDPAAARSQVDAVRLAWYAGNGVTNDRWKNEFTSLPLMANPETFAGRPEAMAKFTASAERYRTLRAQNPAYADSLVDDKSREFLDLYDAAVTDLDMPPEDAMAFTSGWVQRPDRGVSNRRITPNEGMEIVQSALNAIGGRDGGFLGMGGSYNDRSFAIVNQKVQTWANLGLSRDAIQKRVAAWAKTSTAVVNGVVISAERPLPKDFPEVADRFLQGVLDTTPDGYTQSYREAHGIEEADDLFLQAEPGENRWSVWSKSMSTPIGNVYLDDKAMGTIRDQVAGEARALREETAKRWQERGEGRRQAARDYEQVHVSEYYRNEMARIDRLRAGGTDLNAQSADEALERLRQHMQHFPQVTLDQR